MTTTVRTDRRGRGFLASLPAIQRTGIVASIVVGCLLVIGSGAALALDLSSRPVPATTVIRTPTAPIPRTDATSSSPSAAASETTTAGPAAGASQTAAPSIPGVVRAPEFAFRRNGAVWVASETGGGARQLAVSNDGSFSLSPDGLTLALVDASSGQLTLIGVATGVSVKVGPAAQTTPVWAADSSWLVYRNDTDAGPGVVRAAREGGQPRPLGVGTSASISPDGAWVFAVRSDATAVRRLVRIPTGGGLGVALTKDSAAADLTETAVSASKIFFARPESGSSTPMIRSMAYSGKVDPVPLVKAPSSTSNVSFTTLRTSPDGAWLAYQESGDDGYSRLFCVPTAGGAVVKLSLRYDGYLIGWSASGGELLFAEGNTMQGESSRIVAVHPDGSGRRVVLDDAGL